MRATHPPGPKIGRVCSIRRGPPYRKVAGRGKAEKKYRKNKGDVETQPSIRFLGKEEVLFPDTHKTVFFGRPVGDFW